MAGIKGRSGRKSKAEEQELLERLSVYDEDAFRILGDKIKAGEYWAIRLYFLYRFGSPKQMQHLTVASQQKQPLFNISFKSTEEINKQHQNRINNE